MMTNVKKTTPSEDVAWLAGIVDGEGSIGVYTTKQNRRILNFSIVNTDSKILEKVESILKQFNIFYSRYIHARKNENPRGFHSKNQCFVVTVRRRDDFEIVCRMIEPFLIGNKKESVQKALLYLKSNPRKQKPLYYCQFCKKATVGGRKKQFCNQDCWHKFSIGNKNPNYRNGTYIARND